MLKTSSDVWPIVSLLVKEVSQTTFYPIIWFVISHIYQTMLTPFKLIQPRNSLQSSMPTFEHIFTCNVLIYLADS